MATADWVVMGRISGLYGVQGWVKVFSYTEPRTGILDYSPLYLASHGEWRPADVAAGRQQGKGVVLKLNAVDDRDAAQTLIGRDLAVRREQLPALPAGEFYWSDLEGLTVINKEGVRLGRIDHLFATGANDVMVVKTEAGQGGREHLIPFVQDVYVLAVDLQQATVTVDWDPEF